MLALQKIGEILVALPAPQLARIPMDARLADAVNEARTIIKVMRENGRQLQFIGRIMRDTDVQPLIEAL